MLARLIFLICSHFFSSVSLKLDECIFLSRDAVERELPASCLLIYIISPQGQRFAHWTACSHPVPNGLFQNRPPKGPFLSPDEIYGVRWRDL